MGAMLWKGAGKGAVISMALLLTAATAWGAPALAASSAMSPSEKLHRLDVMLKVAAARCAGSDGDLRADYARFAHNHRYALAQAGRDMRQDMARKYGAAEASSAYDRLDYTLADQYRQQHPWLSCTDFKVATRGLAVSVGSAPLIAAADQILPEARRRRFADARTN